MHTESNFTIRPATEDDVPTILALINELAEYERLADEVSATAEDMRRSLFGNHPFAEVVIGENAGNAVSYALFFYNFSTFLARPGMYLEDLYVKPEYRGNGFGRKLLAYLAHLAKERNCGRLEFAVLNWNKPAIRIYEKAKAKPLTDWTVYRLTGDALSKLADKSDRA